MNISVVYLWVTYHFIFIAAFVVRAKKWIKPVYVQDDGSIVYYGFYYYSRIAFTILFFCLAAYIVFIKWILGWCIDDWWLEAGLVFIMFCLGHIVFIARDKSYTYKDSYSKFRVPYIVFSALFIASFYLRFLYAFLLMFSFNVHLVASAFPDIRHNDLYLLKNYHLGYSESKGIVVEKKVFIFRKDLSHTIRDMSVNNDKRDMNSPFFNFGNYAFTADNTEPSVYPFPFSRRGENKVILMANPAHGATGYIYFQMDSSDRLEITGYEYTIRTGMKEADYIPCGKTYVK